MYLQCTYVWEPIDGGPSITATRSIGGISGVPAPGDRIYLEGSTFLVGERVWDFDLGAISLQLMDGRRGAEPLAREDVEDIVARHAEWTRQPAAPRPQGP